MTNSLDRLQERYAELERARDQIQTVFDAIESVELPDGVEGSHHSAMEWGDALETIEDEIQRIDDAIEQL